MSGRLPESIFPHPVVSARVPGATTSFAVAIGIARACGVMINGDASSSNATSFPYAGELYSGYRTTFTTTRCCRDACDKRVTPATTVIGDATASTQCCAVNTQCGAMIDPPQKCAPLICNDACHG